MKLYLFKDDYQLQMVTASQSTDQRSGESSMRGSSSPLDLYVPANTAVFEDPFSKIKEAGYLDVVLYKSGLGIRAVPIDLLVPAPPLPHVPSHNPE